MKHLSQVFILLAVSSCISCCSSGMKNSQDVIHVKLGQNQRPFLYSEDLQHLSSELRKNPQSREVVIVYKVVSDYDAGNRRLSFLRLSKGRGVLKDDATFINPRMDDNGYDTQGGTCESNIHQWARKAEKRQKQKNPYSFLDERFDLCS